MIVCKGMIRERLAVSRQGRYRYFLRCHLQAKRSLISGKHEGQVAMEHYPLSCPILPAGFTGLLPYGCKNASITG